MPKRSFLTLPMLIPMLCIILTWLIWILSTSVCQYDLSIMYDGHNALFNHLEVDLQDGGSVTNALLFLFFSHLILCTYASFTALVVSFMYLPFHVTNGNIPLVQTSCIASSSPCLSLSCAGLCHLSPYTSIFKAIHLIPLITAMTHSCFHRHRVWTYMEHISRSSIYMYIWVEQYIRLKAPLRELSQVLLVFPIHLIKQDRFSFYSIAKVVSSLQYQLHLTFSVDFDSILQLVASICTPM